MKVLFISQNCSLQDNENNLGLTARHEYLLSNYGKDHVELAVAYMADGNHDKVCIRNSVKYYAIQSSMLFHASSDEWDKSLAELIEVVSDYQPDIIHVFGAEWAYGLIVDQTDVPVVIHLMGFLNIYYPSIEMAKGRIVVPPQYSGIRKKLYYLLFRERAIEEDEKRFFISSSAVEEARVLNYEREVMSHNRYFFGRTDWDRNIVKYYSDNGRYFHIEEAVKPQIFDNAGSWKYHYKGKLRLFTFSSADDRKGNEIILRTAHIIKNVLNLDFEWIVAGAKDFFKTYEERCCILHENVNIELIGYVDSLRIIDELQKADFFIHPSIIDNSPHSVCEAQLIGCPVLASNVGGLPQLIDDGVTGWLYPYNEPHTLAFMIGNFYQDSSLMEKVSKQETKAALERHDYQKIADSMIDSYMSIIDSHIK